MNDMLKAELSSAVYMHVMVSRVICETKSHIKRSRITAHKLRIRFRKMANFQSPNAKSQIKRQHITRAAFIVISVFSYLHALAYS